MQAATFGGGAVCAGTCVKLLEQLDYVNPSAVDAKKNKLLQLLQGWAQDHWPACVANGEQNDGELKQQGEA